MDPTSSSRPRSFLSPSSTNSFANTEPALAFERPQSSRSAASSYYRPFSTTYQRPSTADGPLTRRSSNAHTPTRTSMGFNKTGKDKDFIQPRPESPVLRTRKDSDTSLPPPSRFNLTLSLKKKRSFVQLFHIGTAVLPLQNNIEPPSTPVTPITEIPSTLSRDSPSLNSTSHSSTSTAIPPLPPVEDKASIPTMTVTDTNAATPQVASNVEQEEYVAKETYQVNRFKSKVHSYTEDEAPYVRSYEHMDLENDRYNDLLLQRLYPKNSPTFHVWTTAPAKVLDVGSGAGHWMELASKHWPDAELCGLDMMDVVSPSLSKKGKFMLRRGNFVKQQWPFASGSFDLVRICDLTLAMKYEDWEFVMQEVYRVLRREGRLELIDDHLIFPEGIQPPMHAPIVTSSTSEDRTSLRKQKGSSFMDMSDGEDEESDDSESADYSSTEASTSVDESSSCAPPPKHSILEPLHRPSPPTRPLPSLPAQSRPWTLRMTDARDLEEAFCKMLKDKNMGYGPSTFLTDLLEKVFDRKNCCKPVSKHLKLAPPGLALASGPLVSKSKAEYSSGFLDEDDIAEPPTPTSATSATKRKWIPKRKDTKKDQTEKRSSLEGRSSTESSAAHDTISAKAAGRLGISLLDMPAAQKQAARRATGVTFASGLKTPRETSTQSPGLVLWPATFIPLSPSELEMHACKHIHNLIGSKLALVDYIQHWKGPADEGVNLEDQELLDMLWDYENFRRARFNWPTGIPSSRCSSTEPVMLPMSAASVTYPGRDPRYSCPPSRRKEQGPFAPRELMNLRSIRVFSAVKGSRRNSSDTPISP